MTHIIRRNVPTLWNTREEFVTPFSQLFDKIVEQHFPELKEDYAINFGKGSYPKVDIIDRPTGVHINAEVAGWKKENINVEVENDFLTISGKNEGEEYPQPIGEHKYILKEIKRSSFSRSFKLGKNLDTNNMCAVFDNGTLIITIAKIQPEEESGKKTITIQ